MIRKSQIVKIAKSLIGPKGTFADFLSDCIISKKGAFVYATQSASVSSQTLKMIDTEKLESAKEGLEKQSNDIEVIGIYQDLTLTPSVDDTTFTFEGINYKFKSIEIDPAKATITLRGVL